MALHNMGILIWIQRARNKKLRSLIKSMEELINIFIKVVFIENMVFAYFLGMCSYLAISKTVETSVGMGGFVIFALAMTVPINYLLENYKLLQEGALVWLDESFKDVDFYLFYPL